MTFEEYQNLAMRTANGIPEEDRLVFAGLCLAGKAGELANIIKKMKWHGHKVDAIKLLDEAGDCLWYIAYLADALGFDLSTIANMNIGKLKKRYPEGFSKERSINRIEDNTI